MTIEDEHCTECGKVISNRAVANLFNGRVVCSTCRRRLEARVEREHEPASFSVAPHPSMTICVVCPLCEKQSQQVISPSQSSYRFLCPICKGTFASRLTTIRSKNSHQDKQHHRRALSVRVIETTGEGLIEFAKSGIDDLELRSKDSAVFSYGRDNAIGIVQNLTIGNYYKITAPAATGCLLLICLLGAGLIAAGGLVICGFIQSVL